MDLHVLKDDSLRALIRRLAARLRRSPALAQETIEDVAQSLLLGVQARLPRYRPEKAPIEAFVMTAARSAGRTLLRDASRAKRDPGRVVFLGALPGGLELRAGDVGPDPQRERAEAVRAALDALDPSDRAIADDIMRFGRSGARERSGLDRSQWFQTKQRIGLALKAALDGEVGAFGCARSGDGVSRY